MFFFSLIFFQYDRLNLIKVSILLALSLDSVTVPAGPSSAPGPSLPL